MGLQRVEHNWVTNTFTFTVTLPLSLRFSWSRHVMGHDPAKNCSHSLFLDSSERPSRLSQFELLFHLFICSFTKCTSCLWCANPVLENGDAVMNKTRFLPFISSQYNEQLYCAIVLYIMYYTLCINVLYISSRYNEHCPEVNSKRWDWGRLPGGCDVWGMIKRN